MRGFPAIVAVAMLVALPVRADLPADGWPQPRRDARLTARSTEPAPVDPVVLWEAEAGEELSGEAVVRGCDLFVGNGGGEVVRVNARSGERPWRSSRARQRCTGAEPAPAALALDDTGAVFAGLVGDPGLLEAAEMACNIISGIASYAIDNNSYPPGPDLIAALVPTYMTPPVNACTGVAAVHSDASSLGDIRYRSDRPDEYWLGVWWTDDALVDMPQWCDGFLRGSLGLHPTWPVSTELGGSAAVLETADGTLRWSSREGGLAAGTTPVLTPDGSVWSQQGVTPWLRAVADGSLMSLDPGGVVRWSLRRAGGAMGAVARDAASGRLFASHRLARYGDVWNSMIRTIATAVESYSIDANAYPPATELEPLLVPTYVGSWGRNVFTGEPLHWSTTPSPGDYDYATRNLDTEYQLAIWNLEGQRVAIFDTGSFLAESTDTFSSMTAYEPLDGSLVWNMRISATLDPTPLLIDEQGSLVAGDAAGNVFALDPADGAERWRYPGSLPLELAPAALPDGGIVFVTRDGTALCIDPPGLLRWSRALGAAVSAPPSVTADGVALIADAAGFLHALAPLDGRPRWSLDAGGVGHAALTTTPIPHEGWLYVGRADGMLVAIAERSTQGLPEPAGGLLLANKPGTPDDTRLSWPAAALPAVPGAHFHLKRWLVDPRGAPVQALPSHRFVAAEFTDSTPGIPLVFWSLDVADCGENENRVGIR